MASLKAWLAVAACGAAAFTGSAAAQTARSGGSASAQLMQQMQQLAGERTTLQAENDKLKAQLADLTKERDGLRAGQQTLDRKAKEASTALSHSTTQRQALDQELTQTKAKMQELITKFRDTIQKLREVETENTATKQTLSTREHDLATCVDHNHALYQMNDEILTHMEKHGGFSDPFTHLQRIRLENYVDEARGKAQDHLLNPPAPPAAATPPL